MSKQSKIIRIAAGIIFSCLLIVHIVLLVLGRSWVFTTMLFYPAIAVIIISIYRLITIKKPKTPAYSKTLKHLRYSVYLIFAFLLLLDLGLRFFTKKYKSYSEINYGWFYVSPFSDGFSVLKHKYFYGQDDNEFNTHPSNTDYLFETADFKFVHNYNEYGLRERKNIKEVSANRDVILTIGDSFTEGVGTSQDSTWQRILENRLNDSLNTEYLVINAGISGYDPADEYVLMQKLLPRLHPEYVIISIGTNDILDILEREKIDYDGKAGILNQPAGYYFYSWSYIFRAVSTIIFDYPEIFMNKNDFGIKTNSAAASITDLIKKISDTGDKEGFKTIVIFFPTSEELKNYRYKYESFYRIIENTETNHTILSVDMLGFFIQNKNSFIIPPQILYWPEDGHMTPLGYRIWSDILFSDMIINDFIKKNGQ